VGIVNSFEYSIDTGRKAIYGIDSIIPFELAPGPYSITGRIQCVRIRFDGGLEGRGISASQSNLLLEKYVSFSLVDRASDRVIFRLDDAAVITQNWIINERSVMRGSFSFEGLTWYSDSEI